MAAAEEGQAEGLRRRLELLREDMQRKDSDLQASVAEGRQLLEKVQSRRGTAATLGELRRRTEQRVRLDDRSSVSSSAAGSRLDELRAQIAALAQVNDPTTPVRSRQPSQPGSDRRRLKEVEPEVEDTCSLPASAQTPPRAVAADDLGALSRYLENLRRENDAYRQRFVAPPMPADAASGVTSTLAPRSPTSSVVVTAPPPQARGPAAAAPRRKTVLVCGSVAGSGAAFDVDEGVAEDRNLERLRWQLGIDRNTHLGVTDAAGRALRLRYDSVVPDQVCALRLTRSRSKQFWLHDCETPFVLYESLPEETLLAVKERLRLRDDTSLRFTNSAGDDVDLQYASVRDGERLRWQLHSGAAQKPRTRLRYRTISPQHGPTSPDTAQWGNLDAVRLGPAVSRARPQCGGHGTRPRQRHQHRRRSRWWGTQSCG
eukprot:TRINITY_DN10193_c0_g1_i1.p1 TRINITY_DN10193_c0_g1~~TRINITY_DN10193_c0_g1_i1.p1  ORF type:complete len:442 (+),score=151.19 TRINITY_DN10193_c0_g1_i1:41-1327(+)